MSNRLTRRIAYATPAAILLLTTTCAAAPPAGHTEPPYIKKATWQETMLASREALMRQEAASPKAASLPDLGTSDYTIAAWIRTTAGGTVFSRSSLDGVWAERGGKVFYVRGGKLGFDACFVGVAAGRTPVADGKWHHVAATFKADTKQLSLYTDGKPDGAMTLKADPDAPGHVLRIGMSARDFWPPNGFAGDLDDVRVHRRPLTATEIKALSDSPAAKPDADCIAHWPLDRDASDATGNAHAGTLSQTSLVDGKLDRAMRFNGQSSITIHGSPGPRLRQEIWQRIEQDFTDADSRVQLDRERQDQIWQADWKPGDLAALAGRYAAACRRVPPLQKRAEALAKTVKEFGELQQVAAIYYLSRKIDDASARLRTVNATALRLAVEDLNETFPDRYANGRRYLAELGKPEMDAGRLLARLNEGDETAIPIAERLVRLATEALLANPVLDFDRLLLIRRSPKRLGLSQNWESNSSLPKTGYDNEIAVLSPVRPDGTLTTLFRPDGDGSKFVGDVDLHFDADRMLFSMPGDNGRWQVFELGIDGANLRQLPLITEPDVDNYDACYLPDDNVIFCSTAPFVGVPCVTGSSHVCNLYRLEAGTGAIRRLTFEQDHNWCPTMLNNGRVLYLRWEYSDIPHFASRILFHMDPDGTSQMEYYGSNSYWPNAMFYARAVPDHPTKFVAVVGGHHDVPRMGELVLFDPSKGRHEADGVVQRIPGRGKTVEPILLDGLVQGSWPKFLHPYPLSSKYFIVSCMPTPQSKWGIYLVDVFDNMTLLKEVEDCALLEPIPVRKTPKPPVLPNKVQPDRKDAVVYMADVYTGNGLKDVPRGTVKKLRLLTYQFAYHGMGGQVNRVGLDGPWDVKRIIGTVPVETDGSALFRVPANTPISVQPLDDEGKAVQLMRSWMTAMPGEVLSCVGCHERQNSGPPTRATRAAGRTPSEITPWYGPTRGFSFKREVQPVLDTYCVGCHNGEKRPDGMTLTDLRPQPEVHPPGQKNAYQSGTQFTPSYLFLRRFVRAPTIESDMHLLPPYEFHADISRLVRMLGKGHHGVTLDAEAWDRLVTWIDLHAPAHGTWHEIVGWNLVAHQRDRRREMMKRYAGIDEDPEAIYELKPFAQGPPASVPGGMGPRSGPVASAESAPQQVDCPAWPFDADDAKHRQSALGEHRRTIDLGGAKLDLVLIPPGEFIMGGAAYPDESPRARVKIDEPFWIGTCEITNQQFALFDPSHDSRLEHGDFLQFSTQERGYLLNTPRQPVVRVTWNQAMAFCRWLTAKTGLAFTLPTEAQWEFACRAGAETPMSYGQVETDFSAFANLADASLKCVDTFAPWSLPSGAIYEWRPAIDTVNDKHRVTAPVGSYRPNAWGLHDMHGNAAEWTRSAHAPYPYNPGDGRENPAAANKRIVRGGSWYDRPQEARSACRTAYHPWQRVFNVGFRVACPTQRTAKAR
ncbi:MAG: SUMF1/EgtB/PvdO family nonheme iron enzyme [Phycisphaerae bacterium]|nr:SUMF1/EgtB/PvdO family nonheme iron enzyme [Phycisphaerae bacterium]